VVAAIDGAIGMTQCSVHVAGCERTDFCPTRPHWRRINLAVGEALAAVTLADMAMPIAAPAALTQETTMARPPS
jgi:DNA-binding IscR family transcriptional regulator